MWQAARNLKHRFDLSLAAIRDRIDPDPAGIASKIDCNQLQRFEAALRRSSRSLCDFETVLDFGCGDGRFLGLMTAIIKPKQLLGCDVLAARVALCRRRFPETKIFLNRPTPPLDLRDGVVDFIYS
jgi:SAM-dependent methyltransferase